MARVVLAMSGGVDSSVAAHLLREAGHDVIGLFMRHGETVAAAASECAASAGSPSANSPLSTLHSPLPIVSPRADHKQGCCSASDAADARRVADRFDIPFYALDFSDSFGRIMDYFVAEYRAARTPNPCVMCNNWLKFGRLFDYADSAGAEFVATGHYARLAADGALRRGLDAAKDQSYVLFGVARSLLSRMMLPVGDYRKEEIRRIAHRPIGSPRGRQAAIARRSASSPADTMRNSFIAGRVPKIGPARSSPPTARWSASTTGSNGSRSASARGLVSRSANRGMSSASRPTAAALSWERTTNWPASSSLPIGRTGWWMSRPGRCVAWCKFAITAGPLSRGADRAARRGPTADYAQRDAARRRPRPGGGLLRWRPRAGRRVD